MERIRRGSWRGGRWTRVSSVLLAGSLIAALALGAAPGNAALRFKVAGCYMNGTMKWTYSVDTKTFAVQLAAQAENLSLCGIGSHATFSVIFLNKLTLAGPAKKLGACGDGSRNGPVAQGVWNGTGWEVIKDITGGSQQSTAAASTPAHFSPYSIDFSFHLNLAPDTVLHTSYSLGVIVFNSYPGVVVSCPASNSTPVKLWVYNL